MCGDVTGAIFRPAIDYVAGRVETLLAAVYNGTYLTQHQTQPGGGSNICLVSLSLSLCFCANGMTPIST